MDKENFHFRILTDEKIRKIKDVAFEILEQVGCKIHNKEARHLLNANGSTVNGENVRVPRALVEECIKNAPKGFPVFDRNGNPAMDIRDKNVYYGTSTASPKTRDYITGEFRETTIKDIELGARVADALPNIDYVMPMGTAQDVPIETEELHEFYAVVTNTTKPIVFLGYTTKGTVNIYEMASKIKGGFDELREKPFLIAYPEPISPLVFPSDSIEKMFISADLGMPQVTGSTVQPGATAPVTMAGAIAQLIAEGLMSVVLIQLRNPGVPCFLGGNFNILDMNTTLMSIAAPEMSLGTVGYAEVARSFGLPTWGLAGSTDSKLLDAQAGMESIFALLGQALGGLNLIHDVGYMDMAMVCSLEMLVLGDEAISMVKSFVKGVNVDEDSLALDVIKRSGPSGNYLKDKHTLKNYRKELWMPTLLTRTHHSRWVKEGSKSMEDRIKEKIQHILETHEVEPLDDSILKEIEEIKNSK
ncbi:MAG: trimethylamine methyltransferase family protein [Candidatus Hodarchaeota archaeon]